MIRRTEGWRRALALFLLALVGLTLAQPDTLSRGQLHSSPLDGALRRACDWLLRQQAEDGGWHSATYGPMRVGPGNTALVLDALTSLPRELQEDCRPAIRNGLRFQLQNLHEAGFVQSPEGTSDYPTYATALTLTALRRVAPEEWPDEQRRMREYLVLAHQTDRQGWNREEPDYGGWDNTGGLEVERKLPVQTDVTVMAVVLEALKGSGGIGEENEQPALVYLSRCQNLSTDGGLYFTATADDPRNKAGTIDRDPPARPRSYGTATADGLRVLLACGVDASDPRYQAAGGWLAANSSTDVVPGFVDETTIELWGRGLRFYYASALSRVLDALPADAAKVRRASLVKGLIEAQRVDGSWANDVATMREDDPLIATSLAMIALSRLRVLEDQPGAGKWVARP